MAAEPQPLEAGQPAPDFTARAFSGEPVELSSYRGRKVALYFYPKDATPGCTNQACNLRDHLDQLADHGVAAIGVSPDDGVWGEKKNYGKTYLGLQRTTFLIDEDGVIQHVFKRPKTAAHAEEIIGKL